MAVVLALCSTLAWSLVLADLGPNETQVALAAIGAVSGLVNLLYLRRNQRERRQHQAQVRQAIDDHGLVAMVPEQVVKDIAGEPPHNRRAGDEAP